jgi:methionyl-tRNA formyltransferase
VAPLRVIYFGTPDFAVPGLQALIASPHTVVALVSQPDRPKGRGKRIVPTPTKQAAAASGIPVVQPTRLKATEFHDTLRSFAADLGVVAAYGRIIPDAVLEIPRLGMINIHASLLPKYRGAAPIHRAVINGDPETGVTIMRVVTALDAGPVLAIRRVPLGPDATTPDVERALVVEVVDALSNGTAIEVPQDDAEATYAPKIERHEGIIDWSLPADRIHNLVRGLQPWPLVSATLDGVRCLVHRTALTDEQTNAPPGTITAATTGKLAVAAGDGRVVKILDIQPEGKRVMPARDFLAGRRIEPGTRIT